VEFKTRINTSGHLSILEARSFIEDVEVEDWMEKVRLLVMDRSDANPHHQALYSIVRRENTNWILKESLT